MHIHLHPDTYDCRMNLATEVIGFCAVFVSLFNLVPQAVKIHNGGGTHDLSVTSFVSILLAGSLRLVYGFLRTDWPLIMTNIVQILIILYILYKIYMSSYATPVDSACAT